MTRTKENNQKFYEKVEELVRDIERNAHVDSVKYALENMPPLEKQLLEWLGAQPGLFQAFNGRIHDTKDNSKNHQNELSRT